MSAVFSGSMSADSSHAFTITTKCIIGTVRFIETRREARFAL